MTPELNSVEAKALEWFDAGVQCGVCRGPCFAWLTTDSTWAKVEPLLGQEQVCFTCFSAAWHVLGLNDGTPFLVLEGLA